MKKVLNILITTLATLTITGCFNNKDSVKEEIKDIDTNLNQYIMPLGLDSVKLMKSGKVIVTPNDDAIGKGDQTIANNVKKIYIFVYGNAGFRTIMLIKNDGTVSAIDSSKLIQDKKIEVIDNLGNYTNIVSIKQETDQEGRLIYAVDNNNKEYMLDEYIK